MPKVSDEYRESQRARIADSALRVFALKGFQKTSMADIIADSGMSAGAIYAYFPGKADIIAEVAGRVLGTRIASIERLAVRETLPAPSDLIRTILSGLRDELGNPSIVLQVWGEAVNDRQLRPLANEAFGRLLNAFRLYLAA
ncbi:MAG TPA: TetR/AcrR family transcriptional regulator, partial [Terrimesophilobacter sp.]|nr:TetR/AcrR family transcriptional regulator [Terrimesophilobacter sp.]